MKQEDKELLLKDLCARLPYRVKYSYTDIKNVWRLKFIFTRSDNSVFCDGCNSLELCRPYLFPLLSMTEEQEEEYGKCYNIDLINGIKNLYDRLDGKNVLNGYPMYNHIDWLNKNHFDYRGLIEKGLAIDATGLNIY